MHNKPIIKCPKCDSSDIYMKKHLCKCSDCSTIFLISDRTRAFDCSDYEKTFRDRYVQQYRGYNIYEYKNVFNENKLTFWYSSDDSRYISSVETIDDCYELIDKAIEQIEYSKKTEDIEEVKAYVYSGNIYRTIELALEAKDKNENK